ncbi:hypothetical protein AB0C84_46170 [Actinomadura sp. NPDC048955]|uniref:hypothetical protein n=1 Tax=Actinomadura sp. NPDC048955 TaxID=3158228 RepID=UPI0033DD5DC8
MHEIVTRHRGDDVDGLHYPSRDFTAHDSAEPETMPPLIDPLETALLICVQDREFEQQLREAASAAGLWGNHDVRAAEELSIAGGSSRGVEVTIDGQRYRIALSYVDPA